MRSRYWFAICCLPMAITVVTISLIIWITPTREQRAIANLVNTRADIMLFDAEDGSRFLSVDLHGCMDNDEALSYLPDIEKVEGLTLAVAPVHEAGMKSLLRLKGLRYLDVTGAVLATDAFTRLENELKRDNPMLKIRDFHREAIPLNFDKK